MQVVDIHAALAAQDCGTFINLVRFNESDVGACDISGVSPVWEMHPDTDEFFLILEGYFEVSLLDGDEPSTYTISAGSTFVVPKGVWHKPAAPDGCKFVYMTPGLSLHSEAADPRLEIR